MSHYLCSELPTYSIILLLKSERKFICKSCVLAKYQDFPALPGELDTKTQNSEFYLR